MTRQGSLRRQAHSCTLGSALPVRVCAHRSPPPALSGLQVHGTEALSLPGGEGRQLREASVEALVGLLEAAARQLGDAAPPMVVANPDLVRRGTRARAAPGRCAARDPADELRWGARGCGGAPRQRPPTPEPPPPRRSRLMAIG